MVKENYDGMKMYCTPIETIDEDGKLHRAIYLYLSEKTIRGYWKGEKEYCIQCFSESDVKSILKYTNDEEETEKLNEVIREFKEEEIDMAVFEVG